MNTNKIQPNICTVTYCPQFTEECEPQFSALSSYTNRPLYHLCTNNERNGAFDAIQLAVKIEVFEVNGLQGHKTLPEMEPGPPS
jgi:hypothetical protein